jgi:hypothetical protein
VELAESPDTRRLYERVLEAGSLLDLGVATANVQSRQSKSA